MEAVTRGWYESRTGTWITFGTLISLYGEKLYIQRLMLRPRQQRDTEIQELWCFNVLIILLFLSQVLVMFYVISCIFSICLFFLCLSLFYYSLTQLLVALYDLALSLLLYRSILFWVLLNFAIFSHHLGCVKQNYIAVYFNMAEKTK